MEETIYVIMCKPALGEEYAWEARTNRETAFIRERNLQFKNPDARFRTVKTKLVTQ